MDKTLGRITGDGKKRETIKCQLRVRMKVLQQKGSRDGLAFSRSGKALPQEQLMANLKQLFASVPATPVDGGATSSGDKDDQPAVTGGPTPDGSSVGFSTPNSHSPSSSTTETAQSSAASSLQEVGTLQPVAVCNGWLPPAALCHSRWQRHREGSNACTLIAIVLASKLHGNVPALPLPLLPTSFVHTIVAAIEEGNALHDSQTSAYGQAVNYSIDEAVVALQGTVPVRSVDGDLPASFPPLVSQEMTLQFQLPQLALSATPRFAVYVSNTEESYLLVVANGLILLVDSHHHVQHAGLVASGCIAWIAQLFTQQGLSAYGTISVIDFK